ncbi:MAG: WG repeat-containing protein [Bacteroidota bacterium]
MKIWLAFWLFISCSPHLILCQSQEGEYLLFPVKKENRWGFIDIEGGLVLDFQYDFARPFSEGFASVKQNGKWGFINKEGVLVIPYKFDLAYSFSNGRACVKQGEKESYVDRNGNLISPFIFDSGYEFINSHAVVVINDYYTLIDTFGNLICDPVYTSVDEFQEGLARVILDRQNGDINVRTFAYIDSTGFQVLTLEPLQLGGDFKEGLAIFQDESGLFGFMDKDGEVVVRCIYNYVSNFHNGLAGVQIDSKWGFINKSGVIVIQPKFDDHWSFNGNMCWVKEGELWGLIDKKGEYLITPKFIGAVPFWKDKLSWVYQDEKYHVIDHSGTFLISDLDRKPFQYNEKVIASIKNKKHVLFNLQGVLIYQSN